MRDHGDRDAALPLSRSTRRSAPPGIRVPRADQEATVVIVHTDEGVDGRRVGRRRRCPTAALLERLLVGVDPLRTEVVREICETVDFHGGRPWTVEVAVWDLVGKRARTSRCWQLLGGRNERLLAYASSGELVDAGRARAALRRARERASRAVKIRFHHARLARRRRRSSRRCARPSATGSRSWSTRTRAGGCRATGQPRWDVATAAQCARALERARRLLARGAAADRRRRRLRARCAAAPTIRLAAGEMVRAAARGARPRRCAAASTCVQADVVFVGGIGGCRRIAALAELHGRAWSPHTWSNGLGLVANLHAALAFSTVPYVEVPLRPAGLVARSAATGCCRRRSRSRPTARSRRPTGPGLGVELDLDRLERWSDRMTTMRAAVLREPGRPVAGRGGRARLRRGRARCCVRVAAAGVCHSDVHLADGVLGDGRWPMVLGHEGAGVVEAVGAGVTHVAPGRPRRVLLRAVLPRRAAAAAPGGRTSASRGGEHGRAGR